MTREQFTIKVKEIQKALRRFLTALCCGNSALADDIAQEAFVNAYLALDRVKDNSSFNSWIYRIAFNLFLDHKRAQKAYLSCEDAISLPAPQSADDRFRYETFYAALHSLSDKERTSILLFYMEGYSVKEISEITGCTQDAVKQHLARGRAHLRNLLR